MGKDQSKNPIAERMIRVEKEDAEKKATLLKRYDDALRMLKYLLADGINYIQRDAIIDYVESLRSQIHELKEEANNHDRLISMQHKRSMRAIKLWQKAHPGNDDTWPDLGQMLNWMMREMKKNGHHSRS